MGINYLDRYNKLSNDANAFVMEQNNKLINKPKIIFNTFIGSDTVIKPYSDTNIGFRLDDTNLYTDFIQYISKSNVHDLQNDISLIQTFLDNYFVGRENGVNEVCNENKNIHSINKYKNKGGLCIHFSAVSNNLLAIMGYNCEMVWSNIGGENHAFILIHDNDKHYIYDPVNRSKLYDNNNNNSFYKIPTLVEKSNEEIANFYNCTGNLEINDLDEDLKNKKQNNSSIKIILPRLTYDCRSCNQYIDTNKKDVITEYVNHLKEMGLSNDEIENILNKIKEDVLNNMMPKIDDLKPVYEAFKSGSGIRR